MSIELVYEGMCDGTKNVLSIEMQDPLSPMEAGRIVCLDTSTVNALKSSNLLNTSDVPFGILADYKQDEIATGKFSVYFSPGLYRTDQISGNISKGQLLTFDADGKLTANAVSGSYYVGICTESAGTDGSIEMSLNICGYKKP